MIYISEFVSQNLSSFIYMHTHVTFYVSSDGLIVFDYK